MSELVFTVHADDKRYHNRHHFVANEELTQKLYTSIDKVQHEEKDGITSFTVTLKSPSHVRLHWYYQPMAGVITPVRYLTSNGLIEEPLVGMINERTA